MKIIELQEIDVFQQLYCLGFSEKSVDSSIDQYSKRSQNNIEKIKDDIYLGKVAEYAIYNHYKSQDKKISLPDITIYDAKHKSYDADLTLSNQYSIHVKSHYIKSQFPTSWVFQKTDPLIKSPSTSDIIALCVIDHKGQGQAYIDYATTLIQHTKPLVKKYLSSKTAIYLKDIQHLYIQQMA